MIKSPFPGMDPFLESSWRDIHHAFLTYARDAIQPKLPSQLKARLEERVFVEPDDAGFDTPRNVYPDLFVIERGPRKGTPDAVPESPSIMLADDPLIVHSIAPQAISQGYIEIIDASSGNRIVSVVELLSKVNKTPGDGQQQYLKKQSEYVRSNVSLVEIDLLRTGQRILSVPSKLVPRTYQTTYAVSVKRGWKSNEWEIYRIPLQQRLPTIRIPLRESDADIALNLQLLVDQCYINGRYDDIDYSSELSGPLSDSDQQWIAETLLSFNKTNDASH